MNKTRYAILGVLLEGPRTGYEIKSLMQRSTRYFWRESDSTIYPMLKRLAEEGKLSFESVYVGKKRKDVFSITSAGREEFQAWFEGETGSEVPRNEFLLKFFFVTSQDDMVRLFRERLDRMEKTVEEFQATEERLRSLPDSPPATIRLKALQYGMAQAACEIRWLKENLV